MKTLNNEISEDYSNYSILDNKYKIIKTLGEGRYAK